MDEETSKSNRLTSAKTKAVTVPRIPQEIIDEILDHLTGFKCLQSCALVSKSWTPSCRRHLFHAILFTSIHMARWLETFPVPENSPTHLIRHLHFSIGMFDDIPEKFFEYTPWFTNVEKATLSDRGFHPLRIPSFWRLPQSVTSLTIGPYTCAGLMRVRDIMAQLPNLDNLSLSWSIAEPDGALLGAGRVLRGRFCGKLRLLRGCASDADVVGMLLEIPTGIHFTEVQIENVHECLLSAVRLTDACVKTLVKLSYTIFFYRKPFPLLWSVLAYEASIFNTDAIS